MICMVSETIKNLALVAYFLMCTVPATYLMYKIGAFDGSLADPSKKKKRKKTPERP